MKKTDKSLLQIYSNMITFKNLFILLIVITLIYTIKNIQNSFDIIKIIVFLVAFKIIYGIANKNQ